MDIKLDYSDVKFKDNGKLKLLKQETFGLVSAEALACGTPVVVYDNTACPEFITEYTGILIKKALTLLMQ